MALFVGLDLGTSGCRACAIDARHRLCGEASLPLPATRRDQAGGARQQPADWLSSSIQVLRQLGGQLGAARQQIAALAVDGTSGSLLACDPSGQPLGPALMYDDLSCAAELDPWRHLIPADSPAAAASSSLARLLGLQRRYPRGFIALHQADWLLGCLCGQFGPGDENNALKMGYDAVARRWPDWLWAMGLEPAGLPQVHPAGHPLGRICPALANACDLPADTLICTGTTDSTAAALACGIRQPGQAVTVLGSTLAMKVLSERPVFAARYGVYSHRLADLWLVGGASNSGGAVLLEHFSDAQLQQMTPLLRADCPTGLDYYPLSRPGERFPCNDPRLPPRLQPRPQQDLRFFQAMLEGMAEIERQAYDLLARLGAHRVTQVCSIGGGSRNLPWQAIRQQRLGVQVISAPQQQAAFGSALLAQRGFLQRAA
jgi:sugar (pentulose or hexulose) kinase